MATNFELMMPLEALSKEIFEQNLQVLAKTDEYQRTLVGKSIAGLCFATGVERESSWDAEPKAFGDDSNAPTESRVLYVVGDESYTLYKPTTTNKNEIAKRDRTWQLAELMAKTPLDSAGEVSMEIDSEAFSLWVTGAEGRAPELSSRYSNKHKLETLMIIASLAINKKTVWVPNYNITEADVIRPDFEFTGNESGIFIKAFLAKVPQVLEARQNRLNRLEALGAPSEHLAYHKGLVDVISQNTQAANDALKNASAHDVIQEIHPAVRYI